MWIIPGLCFSLSLAAYIFMNQRLKLPADTLMLWRCLGVCGLCLPLIPFVEMPADPLFYVFAALTGVVISFNDGRMLNAVERYGAGPVSRLLPVETVSTFMVWAMLEPERVSALFTGSLWRPVAVCAAILAAGFAMLLFRNTKTIDKTAFLYMLPALLLLAAQNILHKYTAEHAVLGIGSVFGYVLISNIGTSVMRVGTIACRRDGRFKATFAALFTRRAFIGGLCVVPLITALMLTKNIAMSLTPNPAYVTAVGFLSVVWIMLTNRIIKHEDRSDIRIGAVFVVCALVLTFAG